MRVLALADTDSYLKWAAATLQAMPAEWTRELALVETAAAPSPTQVEAAVAGSGIPAAAVARIPVQALRRSVQERAPDAVLVATRGPVATTLMRILVSSRPRPVIATGLPGISIPATRKALRFRALADLFIVHSVREAEEFAELGRAHGYGMGFALAHLPFLEHRPAAGGTDLVFAAQAIVPREREDRRRVARMLVAAARAHPDKRVVLKLRALTGEHQTHAERDPLPLLVALEGDVPPNLVTSTEPMTHALERAEGLVTVSSTALLEAIARGVPVIALDSFGVSTALINTGLVGSGLLAGEADVIARRFRRPDPLWMRDNYFHPAEADDLEPRLLELVRLRGAGALPDRSLPRPVGGRLRFAWERRIAFGRADRSVSGAVALALGVPARAAVRAWRRLVRTRQSAV